MLLGLPRCGHLSPDGSTSSQAISTYFHHFPSRYWFFVIWSIYFSFLFGMMNTAHWLSYFSGVAAWSTSHEVPPQATASRNSWAPTRPAPWISLSFLAIKNGARLYGKESSHDLLLMLVYVGVWGFLIITYNYIVWTLNSLSLFSSVIWIEITINDHKWRFPKIGLPPVIIHLQMDFPWFSMPFLPASWVLTRLPDDAELRRQMPLQSLFQLAPRFPHPQGGEGYIDCIHIIYILYTFAHTHTAYVYTRLCVYTVYIYIYIYIHTV